MDLYPFKSNMGGMEPVAVPGHNVRIIYGDAEYYRQVLKSESIPPFQCFNGGALAAQTPLGPTDAVNLRVFSHEFAQYRWYPIDHVQVLLFLPSADGKYRLRNLMVPVDEMVVERDPCLHLTEIFVYEDHSPFFAPTNVTDYAIAASRIIAQGFRYRITPTELDDDVIAGIKRGTIPCVTIQCSGFAA